MVNAVNNSSANSNSTDSAKTDGRKGNSGDKPKRKYKVQPLYSVMAKARRQFQRQVMQNTETKILCIKANMPKVAGAEDAQAIWGDLMTEAGRLLDSVRFVKYCTSHKLNPGFVAEHLVFEGKAIVNKVLIEGPAFMGMKLNMFNGRLCPDDEKLYPAMEVGSIKATSAEEVKEVPAGTV